MHEGRGGAWGVQEETEAREEGTDGVGRGYLVLFETRAGGISYQSLFVEETLRLWDSGIVKESPLADPLKREHGEKFKGKQRWGDTRRKTERGTGGGIKFREGKRPWVWCSSSKDINLSPVWWDEEGSLCCRAKQGDHMKLLTLGRRGLLSNLNRQPEWCQVWNLHFWFLFIYLFEGGLGGFAAPEFMRRNAPGKKMSRHTSS